MLVKWWGLELEVKALPKYEKLSAEKKHDFEQLMLDKNEELVQRMNEIILHTSDRNSVHMGLPNIRDDMVRFCIVG